MGGVRGWFGFCAMRLAEIWWGEFLVLFLFSWGGGGKKRDGEGEGKANVSSVDDGDRVDALVQLVGHVFLTMLALLGSRRLLSSTSEIRDLGLVMALYMHIASSLRADFGLLEGSDDGKKTDEPNISRFEDYVLAYSVKHGVSLYGPEDIEEIIKSCDDEDMVLPAASATKPDPWKVGEAIRKYEDLYGVAERPGGRRGKPAIGGDRFNITA